MTGLAIFAHGSTVTGANDGVRLVTAEMARQGGYDLVEAAFLELAAPDLPEAVEKLIQRGATRIVVVPYFLTLGIHLQRDLPRIVDELRRIHTDVEFHVTEPLDGHPALVEILLERAAQAIHGGSDSASAAD
jgi:sirohydrochlorin ferrochelatase